MKPLLDIDDLGVRFGDGPPVVRGVDLTVNAGEILGLVGESGSGKSVTCLSALRLHGPSGHVTGAVRFEGRDVLTLDQVALTKIRGAAISMIFQDPVGSLNPIKTIGRQIVETIQTHRTVPQRQVRDRALALLRQVGLPDPARAFSGYPHQMSGGMCQRAMIAIALAAGPRLLIADEPTTALDVTIQAQILDLLKQLRDEHGMAILLVTHDLGVVAETCDRVAVMYAGELVETGPAAAVLRSPRHPYTRGLLDALPQPGSGGALIPIEGTVPAPDARPAGCVFAPRCPRADAPCAERRPALGADGPERAVACHHPVSATLRQVARRIDGPVADGAPVLAVSGLRKGFALRGKGLFGNRRSLTAVAGIDFSIGAGETLALVGESGCGKSTVAKLLTGIHRPDAGRIAFAGQDLATVSPGQWRRLRPALQLVFQDPLGALNPRIRVGAQIAEPLKLHRRGTEIERRARAIAMLERLGLEARYAERFPHQLSGGQRQRVVLARALILEPELLVCDEPIAALDVSIQAQVVNLLAELQTETGVSILFISHDLRIVRHLAHRVAVMYLGRIVEHGPTEALFHAPAHPYTQALLSAMPEIAQGKRARIRLAGEPPNPLDPPAGCPFNPRCAQANADCTAALPEMRDAGPGHRAACLRVVPAPERSLRLAAGLGA